MKILYDSFGSFFSSFYRMFNKYGRGIENFKIRPFSLANSLTRWRFQMRNHRKLLVVDGRIGFLGGVNISEGNVPVRRKGESAIHDLHCRLEGPVVGELEMSFLRDWFLCVEGTGGGDSENGGVSAAGSLRRLHDPGGLFRMGPVLRRQ